MTIVNNINCMINPETRRKYRNRGLALAGFGTLAVIVAERNGLFDNNLPQVEIDDPVILGSDQFNKVCVGELNVDELGNWDANGDGVADYNVPDPVLCINVETLVTEG
jgi:hypothetical protein